MRTAFLLLGIHLCAMAGDPPPRPPDRETFTFVIFGDRTGGRPEGLRVLERAVAASNRLDPDLTMTVGDLVQGYSTGDRWLEQMHAYKAVMSKLERPWYPVAGNHDTYGNRDNPMGNDKLYQEHFAPLWYSFDYKWAHFVVLFSDEHLSPGKPRRSQNMSQAQLDWLRDDLKKTKAKQIFCFLHHPRWTYRNTNWPETHKVLAADGRVKAVFAGHIHRYRDDGLRDGIHYYVIAVTGGNAGRLPSSLHHMNHVKVTPDGFTMSVLPLGSVVGSNLALGSEVDRVAALGGGFWLEADHGLDISLTEPRESHVHARLTNPEKVPVAYELRLDLPEGWTGNPGFVGGQLEAGAKVEQEFKIRAPAFDGKNVRRPRLRATLFYPMRSGLLHPVHHSRPLRVRVHDVPSAPSARNHVLALDGKSAVRVDVPVDTEVFTLEAWVSGKPPRGMQGIASKTEQSAFGLWWCYRERDRPYGVVGFKQGGYMNVMSKEPWNWQKWTHLALVCGEKKVRFFVDGKLTDEKDRPGERTRNFRPLFIGADTTRRNNAGQFFNGAIDEVRLSNVERYKKAFRPRRVLERDDGTLLLLHFDQRVKGLFPDDSGKHHHGWAVGNARLVEEKRP